MTIDERIEALTMNLELLSRDREEDKKAQKERNIRIDKLHADMMLALARLLNTTEAHNGLEGQ
jgi:hypothetical protein